MTTTKRAPSSTKTKTTGSRNAAAKNTTGKDTAAKSTTAKSTTAKSTTAKSTAAGTKSDARGTRSVDPRIAARRIEVKRTEGRRRLRTLLLLSAVTLVAVGTIAALNSSLADVDRLVVTGAVEADPAQIETASGILTTAPLLDIDVAAARTAIRQIPWVLDVSIERTWHGDVVIEIVERTPAAVLPSVDGYVQIDSSGRQLRSVAGFGPDDLPVAGITASGELGQPAPPETQAVLRLVAELDTHPDVAVSQIVVDGQTLYLDLASGGRVKVGDDTALDAKMISLETILARVDLRCLWEIDVRVPTAPAVTRIDAAGNPRATLTDLSQCS
jgi:cell division protein FtsQ